MTSSFASSSKSRRHRHGLRPLRQRVCIEVVHELRASVRRLDPRHAADIVWQALCGTLIVSAIGSGCRCSGWASSSQPSGRSPASVRSTASRASPVAAGGSSSSRPHYRARTCRCRSRLVAWTHRPFSTARPGRRTRPRAASRRARRRLPRHRHREPAQALLRGRASGERHRRVRRDPRASALFLQTKFTYRDGQDHRLPYDPDAPLATQVAQSFASLARAPRRRPLDSLRAARPVAARRPRPRGSRGVARDGGARRRGPGRRARHQQRRRRAGRRARRGSRRSSRRSCRTAATRARGWDVAVRALCREHGIIYQGFSLLTANRNVLASPRSARSRSVTARRARRSCSGSRSRSACCR